MLLHLLKLDSVVGAFTTVLHPGQQQEGLRKVPDDIGGTLHMIGCWGVGTITPCSLWQTTQEQVPTTMLVVAGVAREMADEETAANCLNVNPTRPKTTAQHVALAWT